MVRGVGRLEECIINKFKLIMETINVELRLEYSTSKNFDHDKFWQWGRDMSIVGHTVFVSEYNAPADFECVWS